MHFHPIRWEVKFRPKQFCRHFTTSWNRQKFSSNGSWGEPWRGVGAEGVADLTLPSLLRSLPPSPDLFLQHFCVLVVIDLCRERLIEATEVDEEEEDDRHNSWNQIWFPLPSV